MDDIKKELRLSNATEDILKSFWCAKEETGNDTELKKIIDNASDVAIDELVLAGFISINEGAYEINEKGLKYAREVIRYHRLAECLMSDVLYLRSDIIDSAACKLEHIIHPSLDENICTLLGHPKKCPHGKDIPPGQCCKESKWTIESIVRPLTVLKPKQKGKVAYLHTQDEKKLHKLMAMGLIPGMKIALLHKFPSYVFRVGNSTAAIDKNMASAIYVWLEK